MPATVLSLPLAEERVTFNVRTPGALKTSSRVEPSDELHPSVPSWTCWQGAHSCPIGSQMVM